MSRLLVFALVVSLGNTSSALAGETLLTSATRVAREAARHEARSFAAPASVSESPSGGTRALAQQGLASSGMSRRTKIIIGLVAAAGYVVTAYAIDHKVQDNTPSSLGTRKD